MNLAGVMSKKVAGVPVLYLAGGAAVVLAVVAYRMKPSASLTDTAAVEPGPDDANSEKVTNPYEGFEAKGSVTAPAPVVDPAPEVLQTNTSWLRDGVLYAMKQGHSGTEAGQALDKYLRGMNRSYNEQIIVDEVVKAQGPPPDSIDIGGVVGAKPAQKQFDKFPGTHVIKNDSDNGYPQLAKLYYNRSDAEVIGLLRGANPSLGASGPWPTGTRVKVPAFKVPKYFTATQAVRSSVNIAKKNGITTAQLGAMNPGMSFPVKAGTKVRVG